VFRLLRLPNTRAHRKRNPVSALMDCHCFYSSPHAFGDSYRPVKGVSGRTMRNSSPPWRPTLSCRRNWDRAAKATSGRVLISQAMAKLIVDGLEVGDVKHCDTQRVLVARLALTLFCSNLEDAAAIECCGQRIGRRQHAQLTGTRFDQQFEALTIIHCAATRSSGQL